MFLAIQLQIFRLGLSQNIKPYQEELLYWINKISCKYTVSEYPVIWKGANAFFKMTKYYDYFSGFEGIKRLYRKIMKSRITRTLQLS